MKVINNKLAAVYFWNENVDFQKNWGCGAKQTQNDGLKFSSGFRNVANRHPNNLHHRAQLHIISFLPNKIRRSGIDVDGAWGDYALLLPTDAIPVTNIRKRI